MKVYFATWILLVLHCQSETNVKDLSFPFLVNICFESSQICVGTLVQNSWVLTAAHCLVLGADYQSVSSGEDEGLFTLQMGVRKIQLRKSKRIIIHQGYEPETKMDDIALIKTNKPFEITSEINIIRPETINIELDNVNVTVATWGWVEEQNSKCMRGELQILTLPLLPNAECKHVYSSIVFKKYFEDNKINCAGLYGEHSCNGDGGSPVVYDEKLIAIVSLNPGCQKIQPSLNTKVAYYSHWIEVTTKQISLRKYEFSTAGKRSARYLCVLIIGSIKYVTSYVLQYT